MSNSRLTHMVAYIQSFVSGIISRLIHGVIGDPVIEHGLTVGTNVDISPLGGATKRHPSKLLNSIIELQKAVRLLVFRYSITDVRILVFTPDEKKVLVLNSITGDKEAEFDLPHTYNEQALRDMQYSQSLDVITLVEKHHPMALIKRHSISNWTGEEYHLVENLPIPVIDTVKSLVHRAPKPSSTHYSDNDWNVGVREYVYVVTSLKGFSESFASKEISLSNDLQQSGGWNRVEWTEIPEADGYNIYVRKGGAFAFLGTTTIAYFKDDGLVIPDPSKSVPMVYSALDKDGEYPATVGYFAQRKIFSGSLKNPQTVDMTKAGTESDVTYGDPPKDDDAIRFRMASREATAITNILPIGNTVFFCTSQNIWALYTMNTEAITPKSISVKPVEALGVSHIMPAHIEIGAVVNKYASGSLFYIYPHSGGVETVDMTIRVPEIFEGKRAYKIQTTSHPYTRITVLLNDGTVAVCSFTPSQKVMAWTLYTFGKGKVIDLVATDLGDESGVFLLIQREDGVHFEKISSNKPTHYVDSYTDSDDYRAGEVYGFDPKSGHPFEVGVTDTNKFVHKDSKETVPNAIFGFDYEVRIGVKPPALQNSADGGLHNYNNIQKISCAVSPDTEFIPYQVEARREQKLQYSANINDTTLAGGFLINTKYVSFTARGVPTPNHEFQFVGKPFAPFAMYNIMFDVVTGGA